MTDGNAVAAAVQDLAVAAEAGGDVAGPFADLLDVSAVGVSTLTAPFEPQIISASNDRAGRLDEIQIDLGEGPAWESLGAREPVLEPDLGRSVNTAWPLTMSALQEHGVGAVFAFPLVAAGISIGAVTLYSDTAATLTAQQIKDTSLLTAVLSRHVLHRAYLAAQHDNGESGPDEIEYSRREVHQATGMILAQMRIPAKDALLVLQGYAFAHDRSVQDVAADVIDRTLDFSTTTDDRRI